MQWRNIQEVDENVLNARTRLEEFREMKNYSFVIFCIFNEITWSVFIKNSSFQTTEH